MSFIYLIRDDFTGLYKIGRSKDPERRLKDLQHEYTKLPIQFNFRLLEVWPCIDPVDVEKFIHDVFENDRVRGEWFDLEGGEFGWGTEAWLKFDDFMTCIPHMEAAGGYQCQSRL